MAVAIMAKVANGMSLSFELAARELEKPPARLLVRPGFALDVAGDFLCDGPHLGDDARTVLGVCEQAVDPRAGTIRRHVVGDEQLPQQDAFAIWTPPSTPAIEPIPTSRPARRSTLPCRRCRHVPTMTVGRIASKEVASACTWVSPSTRTRVGTKRMPPPTPKSQRGRRRRS